ncbi:MAG: signal peptidase I [Clostridiales bacterium]|nr:signal peptidase I [Clostridiales bacterium]
MLKGINSDKKRVYLACFILLCCLPIALFIEFGSLISAVFLGIYAFVVIFLFRKRNILSVYKRQVLLLLTVASVLLLVIFYVFGLAFGFNTRPEMTEYFFFTDIIPFVAIIIATEIIRNIFLGTNSKIAYVTMLLVGIVTELIVQMVTFNITSGVIYIVGMVIIPAVTTNVFLNYVSKRYGVLPGIVYRIIMSLYVYAIPVIPNVQEALHAFLKIVAPLVCMYFLHLLFDNKRRFEKHKKKTWKSISTVILVVIMTGVIMLISGHFRFGAIVIATESMTGEVNKGDVVIYERYDDQQIVEGQVIIFERYGGNVVHRVVDIRNENGIVMYFTKGDANETMDEGFVTESQIVGLTRARVPFIGYPTVWLNSIFS